MAADIPIVAFVGTKDVGKTAVVEGVVSELSARGWRVATVKHSAHDFDADVPGSDSHRLTQAGAVTSMVSSAHRFAAVRSIDEELTLAEIAGLAGEVDILIAEGYKSESVPRIEVSRRECSEELVCGKDDLVALVTDHAELPGVPAFSLDDAPAIASFIEDEFLSAGGSS